MQLLTPGHARYEAARALYNGMIDKRPAVIAECQRPSDVAAALEHARLNRLDVAVRAGGHSVAGMSTNEGGLVVDVRPMKAIEVDLKRRIVRCGAGVTWGELDHATQEHGLATTGGRVTTTGVAGFTLGGGSGWIERRYGLACDNLVAVELVTADGREVRASVDENVELFWALHGGGGNFGVATAFELQLHPVGPIVLAGIMAWPADAAPDVARTYRDLANAASDDLGSGILMLTGPPAPFIPEHLLGTTLVAVAVCWIGEMDEGRDVVKALRDLQPEVDIVDSMPYAEFQAANDDPPGNRNYWTADFHDSFDDDALDVWVKYGMNRPAPETQQLLIPWGGAVSRVAEEATPITHRSTKWVSHPFAVWTDPFHDDDAIAWAKGFRRDIAHHANGGIYLNFIGDEGDDRIRAAYGDAKYARLQAIKREWDPGNVFRGNQNIKPEA